MMSKNWKKLLAATACIACLSGVGITHAAYELSDEVKDATLALIGATSIGIQAYENSAFQQQANKDAILIMSFGTTYKDTRTKTIDAIVKKIKTAFPSKEVRVAFTSHIIIDRILENEGVQYDTPEAAFKKLAKDGYNRVAVVNLNIVPGIEYDYNRLVTHAEQAHFKKLTVATPAMYYMGQEEQPDQVVEFLNAVQKQFPPKTDQHSAILLMAHGTPHPSNAYYSVIQDRIHSLGWQNVFVYSVEGRPHLEDVLPKLKSSGIKDVTLMPIMIVAGDHANNDMAGTESDSHKSILEAAGYHVDAYLHGLGENEAIQDLFVERAREAVDALDTMAAKLPYTPKMHHHK